jgi:hypothetical protein
VTRDDLIVGFLGEYQRRRDNKAEEPFEAALIVCGRKGKYQLSPEVESMLHNGTTSAPVMCVGYSTHDAMSMIHRFTPKLNIDDTNRVMVATEVRREKSICQCVEISSLTTSHRSSSRYSALRAVH